jgi:hypothetical protein
MRETGGSVGKNRRQCTVEGVNGIDVDKGGIQIRLLAAWSDNTFLQFTSCLEVVLSK